MNYRGPFARPRYFRVEYSNGQVEDGLTTYMVTKGKGYRLQPEGVPRWQKGAFCAAGPRAVGVLVGACLRCGLS